MAMIYFCNQLQLILMFGFTYIDETANVYLCPTNVLVLLTKCNLRKIFDKTCQPPESSNLDKQNVSTMQTQKENIIKEGFFGINYL
uniref:Uncharacterized protein n=1 Tax=Arion vulgaris TaxID=1028688 RepID=A0A0B6ZF03_9EUPU